MGDVLDRFGLAAFEGLPPPSKQRMANDLGCGFGSVSEAICCLEASGQLIRERRGCAYRIRVQGLDRWTAWSVRGPNARTQLRRCLRCSVEFASRGPGNRICRLCRKHPPEGADVLGHDVIC